MARKAGFRASEAGSLTSATGLPVGIYKNIKLSNLFCGEFNED